MSGSILGASRRGDSFVSAINYALLNATNFVLLYSREASISKWVINEANAAIVRRNQLGLLRIHPVLLDDAPLPPLLAEFHAIDSRSVQFDDLVRVLVYAIQNPNNDSD
jgi:hypothetical protein